MTVDVGDVWMMLKVGEGYLEGWNRNASRSRDRVTCITVFHQDRMDACQG